MHVFIDTNVLLSFFGQSKDDLEALTTVFGSHQHGSATVHLTEQVRHEFVRNREKRIADALKQFKDAKLQLSFPVFMKSYEHYDQIQAQLKDLKEKYKAIEENVLADVVKQNLLADHLIRDIFSKRQLIALDKDIYDRAYMRMMIGNPPGKNKSMGDMINWLMLLDQVPEGKDLHIISSDGDFYSIIDEKLPHPFLEDEWSSVKKSKLRVYRTIKDFLKEHFDGVAFTFDDEKNDLIAQLARSGSFATTHALVAQLEAHNYFSVKEVVQILDAAKNNSQVGSIVTDADVCDFLNRVAVPRKSLLADPEHVGIVETVINYAKLLADLRS